MAEKTVEQTAAEKAAAEKAAAAKATAAKAAAAKAAENEVERITVRSTIPAKEDGGNEVVLWERHPDHPEGQCLIAGPTPVKVALTPEVSKLLRDGKIEEIDA